MKACCQPLHEDTFGGNLKVGLAQVAAMEISKGNHRDNKAVVRYLPWLYHPPSAMQQGWEPEGWFTQSLLMINSNAVGVCVECSRRLFRS